MKKPKILALDIETSLMEVYTFGIGDQYIGLEDIKQDWHVMSWAASWVSDEHPKVMYRDQRRAKDITNDKETLREIWKLLDECDIVLTQNGKRFDIKRLNARFIKHGFQPPSSFKHIDTLQISRKNFSFTSHKLAYMTKELCPGKEKSSHKKFPGKQLWIECAKGNKQAWDEMAKYNKQDIVSLIALYKRFQGWDNTVNFNLYNDSDETICNCGSTEFKRNGYAYTSAGKYQRFKCAQCGHETRSKQNLLTKEKRKSLRPGSR